MNKLIEYTTWLVVFLICFTLFGLAVAGLTYVIDHYITIPTSVQITIYR